MFEKHHAFDERYKITGDYDFLLRELKDHHALFLESTIICMGTGGASYSLTVKEVLLAWKSNNMPLIPWLWVLSYIKCVAYSFLSKLLGEGFSLKFADFLRRIRGKKNRWNI